MGGCGRHGGVERGGSALRRCSRAAVSPWAFGCLGGFGSLPRFLIPPHGRSASAWAVVAEGRALGVAFVAFVSGVNEVWRSHNFLRIWGTRVPCRFS